MPAYRARVQHAHNLPSLEAPARGTTLPPAPALFEREVGDEPDRWALRVGDPEGRARRLNGHDFFGSRLPEAKAYSGRAPLTSSLSPRAVARGTRRKIYYSLHLLLVPTTLVIEIISYCLEYICPLVDFNMTY